VLSVNRKKYPEANLVECKWISKRKGITIMFSAYRFVGVQDNSGLQPDATKCFAP